MAITRKEQIANGQKIAPLTREELRLAGKTFAPLTEEEVFQKAAYSGGTKVEGEISIESNGEHDVAQYATANVNVPASAVVSGTKNITANGSDIDVTEYAKVDVNVQGALTKTITLKTSGVGTEAYCYNRIHDRNSPANVKLRTIYNNAQESVSGHEDYEKSFGYGGVAFDNRCTNCYITRENDEIIVRDILILGVASGKTLEFNSEASNGSAELLGTFTKLTGTARNCYVYLITSKKGDNNYLDNAVFVFTVANEATT